jgi:hypothetical protein
LKGVGYVAWSLEFCGIFLWSFDRLRCRPHACLLLLWQLKYLAAVLQESMRLFPVVSSGTIRITDKPINLAGHQLPAGQPILIPFYSIHRSPKLWTDPESFKPERWTDSGATVVTPAAARPAASAGRGAKACSSGSRSSTETHPSDEYVDVGEDFSQMRDQLNQEQHLAKQGGFKQQDGSSTGAQAPSAQAGLANTQVPISPSEAATSRSSGAGLELKVSHSPHTLPHIQAFLCLLQIARFSCCC